uniref:Uncharacterized protein n=1 Tax=Timema poppense TaxID=170557 RepID=A0A7R9DSD5_TIMPO|nr:unnamed protein product [Timema poppensis]
MDGRLYPFGGPVRHPQQTADLTRPPLLQRAELPADPAVELQPAGLPACSAQTHPPAGAVPAEQQPHHSAAQLPHRLDQDEGPQPVQQQTV